MRLPLPAILALVMTCALAHAEDDNAPPPLDAPAATPTPRARPPAPTSASAGTPDFPSGAVALRAWVDPPKVLLGDRFHLVVEVKHPVGHKVVLPKAVKWGELESAGTVQHTVRSDEPQNVVETFRFPLQAFKLGAVDTPEMQLSIPGIPASEEALLLDAIPIDVVGLSQPQKPLEEAPMAGVVPLMREDPRFLAWPPLLALFGLLWLLVRWLDKKRPVHVEKAAVLDLPRVPPHRIALEALEALKKRGLIEQGKTDQFIDEAVQIGRDYLERAYGVPVLELTTEEAIRSLGPAIIKATLSQERRRLGRLDMELVRRVLTYADAVKFAKRPAEVNDCARVLDEVVQLVETTRPLGPASHEGVAA